MSCLKLFKTAIISFIILSILFVNESFSAELPVKFFFGHNKQVLSTAFSPLKPILASASGKEIILWDAQSTKELAKLNEHQSRITSLDFSSQGLLASSSEDGTIILWDLDKLDVISQLVGHSGAVSSVSFSPDGNLLISGGNDYLVKVWEVNTLSELAVLHGHEDAVLTVSFSPDGRLIASGSGDGTVRLWNTDTYQQVEILQDHTGYVWTLAFSPDGTQLASGSWDGTVRLWNLQELEESELLADLGTFVSSVDYSPDGKLLAVGLFNCETKSTVRIWSLKERKELRNFETKSVHSLNFSPDQSGIVVSGSSDGVIKMWNSVADNIPVGLSPKSDTLIQTPYVTLTWNEAFGAVYYEIEIAKNSDFTEVVQEAKPVAYEKFEYEVGSEVRYWWHVRSCGFGEVGDWSPAVSFKTRSDLPEQAVIRVDPPSTLAYVNEEFEVNVKVENAEEITGFAFDYFTFDSDVLELLKLRNIGKILGPLNVKFVKTPEINNEEGTVSQLSIVQTEYKSVPYQGVFFTAEFRAKATGSSNLQLKNVVLTDSRQNKLKCEVQWGNVQVIERTPAYDVNEDGKVNILDIILVNNSLGKKVDVSVSPNPDVNRDGIVDDKDIEIVSQHLGENYYISPPPGPPELSSSELYFAPLDLDRSPTSDSGETDWLGQNFPNPFNPETWIPYNLSENSHVTIDIYSSQGKKIRTLNVGYQMAGKHINRDSSAYWDGKNELGEPVSSGIYFYSIHTDRFSETKKMVILR